MMGIGRGTRRALVAVGSDNPPDCLSLPTCSLPFDHRNQSIPTLRLEPIGSYGGDDGNRTHDPLLAGQVLSQLSYTPI